MAASTNKESISDPRNFRMLYYEQLGLRNVDQMKALELLLKDDPLDLSKIRKITQQFSLPLALRSLVWKVLLNIIPAHRESNEFVLKHRTGAFEDLKQALVTMRMIHTETSSYKTIVLAYLLEHGMLSVLHSKPNKNYGRKVCILESISEIIFHLVDNECDVYWISKHMLHDQEKHIPIFAKLPHYVCYYLQMEDHRLYEHLCEIQLFKILPYDKWFQTYFRSVFSESLPYLGKIWDKLVAGYCHILVFVCVSLLLTHSILLKELSCDAAYILVCEKSLSQHNGQAVIDKTMELWEQHHKTLIEAEVRRIGNFDWCVCVCDISVELDTYTESLCCKETKEILDILFEESYLVCHLSSVADGTSSKNVQCAYACITYNDYCFCREQFDWTFQDTLINTSYNCRDITCENNVVIKNSYSSHPYCNDPLKSVVYDIAPWYTGNYTANFLNIGQRIQNSDHLEIFEKLTVDVLAPSSYSIISVNFGSNLVITTTTLPIEKFYSSDDFYTIEVNVTSQVFTSYQISRNMDVHRDLGHPTIECTSTLYYINKAEEFYCTGTIAAGKGLMTKLMTGGIVNSIFNITSPQVFSPRMPCFFECISADLSVLQPFQHDQGSTSGIYLLPDVTFDYDGYIAALEFYAGHTASIKLQIYELSGNIYNKIVGIDVDAKEGYNAIRISDTTVFPQKAVVGFWMPDCSVLETVAHFDGKVVYYHVDPLAKLITSQHSYSRVTFRVKIYASTISHIYFHPNLNMTGIHDIWYQVTDKDDVTKSSGKITVKVLNYYTNVGVLKTTHYAFLDKPYTICATIENGANSDVSWTTNSSSIVERYNGVERHFDVFYNVISGKSTIEECHTLYFKENGYFQIKIKTFLLGLLSSTTTLDIYVYPPITGMKLTQSNNVVGRPYLTFDMFHFSGSVNNYPFPLKFTYNFGNKVLSNLTRDQLDQSHYFDMPGIYNITLTAGNAYVSEVLYLIINVASGYFIDGSNSAKVNGTPIDFTIKSHPSLAALWDFSQWVFEWYLDGSLVANATGNNKYTSQLFSSAEKHQLQCILKLAGTLLTLKFEFEIFEDIPDFQIVLPDYALIRTDVVVSANLDTNSTTIFTWSSTANLKSSNGATATIYSTVAEQHAEVMVTASNPCYSSPEKKSFIHFVEPLKKLNVNTSPTGIQEGESVEFAISSVGGYVVSYRLYFPDDASTVESSTNVKKTFNTLGIFDVTVTVLMKGDVNTCKKLSNVACSTIVTIEVLKPIQTFYVSYETPLFSLQPLDEIIYLLVKTSPQLSLSSTGGTNVKFELVINEKSDGENPGIVTGDETKATVKISHGFFIKPGRYSCAIKAFNKLNNISKSFIVYVFEMLEGLTIAPVRYIGIDDPFLFSASSTKGKAVNSTWDFGDGNSKTVSTSNVTHTFFILGNVTVTVNATNVVSNAEDEATVEVIEPLKNVSVDCGSLALTPKQKNNITLTLDQGQYIYFYANNTYIAHNVTGPFSVNYLVSYDIVGEKTEEMLAISPLGEVNRSCNFIVENKVLGSTLSLNESSSLWVGDSVEITVKYTSGEHVKTTIYVYTHNNFIVKTFSAVFPSCSSASCKIVRLHHVFNRADHFYVTGTIFNNVSSQSLSAINVNVYEPKSSSTLEGVKLLAKSAELGFPTSVHVVFSASSLIDQCVVRFIDTYSDSTKVTGTLSFAYSTSGNHNISMTCFKSNELNLELKAVAIVQEYLSLAKVTTPQSCVKYGDEFNITLELSNMGMMSYLQNTVTMNSSIITPKIKLSPKSIIFTLSPQTYIRSGRSNYFITLENLVSQINQTFDVCVMKEIESITSQTPMFWRYGVALPFKFEIVSEVVNSLNITFGDGSLRTLDPTTETLEFTHLHGTVGKYFYTLEASNDVSYSSLARSVEVIQLINNVDLGTGPGKHWPDNKVNFTLIFNEGLSAGMTIQAKLNFGDETASSSQMQDVQIKASKLVGNEYNIGIYEYANAGCYDVTVTLQGNINWYVIKKQVSIDNFDFLSVNLASAFSKDLNTNVFPNHFPLSINILKAPLGNCFSYQWTLTNTTNHLIAQNTSVKPEFFVTDVIGLTGSFYFQLIVIGSFQQKILSTKSLSLLQSLPTLYMTLIETVSNSKTFLVLTEDVSFPYLPIQVDFGDNTTAGALTPKFLPLTDRSIISDKALEKDIEFKTMYVFQFNHTYNSSGLFVMTADTSNIISTWSAAKKVFVSEMLCAHPTVVIPTPLNSGLFKAYYTKLVSVHIEVTVNCSYTNKVNYRWSIYQSFEWEQQHKIKSEGKTQLSLANVALDRSSLNIHQGTLNGGVYIVKVVATLDQYLLTASHEIHLHIIEESMQAFISGGSVQEIAWKDEVVLDASKSYDPNRPSSTSHYDWYCTMLKTGSDCFGNGKGLIEYTGALWRIPAMLLLESTAYKFIVVVSNKYKSASADQTIILYDKDIPIVNIECKSNCHSPILPSARLSLEAKCSNCLQGTKYLWSDSQSVLVFGENTMTSASTKYLVVKPNTFQAGKSYSISFTVTNLSGVFSTSTYDFSVNAPPQGGDCLVSPSSGVALQTLFQISCFSWKSAHSSLSYRVFETSSWNGEPNYKLLSHGVQIKPMYFTSGKPDHNVTVIVEVVDLLGSYTAKQITFKVNETSSEERQQRLLELTYGKDNLLTMLQARGDTQGVLRLITAASQTLSIENQNYTYQYLQQQKEIRNNMVEAVSQMEFSNLNEVKQAGDVITPLLGPEQNIQSMAKISFSKMASFLRTDKELSNFGDPDVISKVTEGMVKGLGDLLNAVVAVNTTYNTTMQGELTTSTLDILEQTLKLLSADKLPGEAATDMESETIAILVLRTYTALPRVIHTLAKGYIALPGDMLKLGNQSAIVNTKMTSLLNNPYIFDDSANGIVSPVVNLEFSDVNNTRIVVENLKEDVHYYVPHKAQAIQKTINTTWLMYNKYIVYKFTVTQPGSVLVFRLLTPPNHFYSLLLKKGRHPSWRNHDVYVACNDTVSNFFIHPTNSDGDEVNYYIALTASNGTFSYYHSELMNLEVFTTNCLYWHENFQQWLSDGCRVGEKTTSSMSHCRCNHLTWLAGNFILPPNKLDIQLQLQNLKNIDDYPLLLTSVCLIFALYVITMVWARRKDFKEAPKREPIFLPSTGIFSYHITVYTGHRAGSNTTAQPWVVFCGEKGSTAPIALKTDTGRQLFERGSVETFVFATDVELGVVKCCTVWHDDAGDDPAWFLSRILVTLLDSEKQYVCFCNDWLAIDISDGAISRILPVATKDELESFENVFLAKTAREFTDGHMWFSILFRPPRSNFTRMQRVTCCLTMLLTTMLANAMFYNVAESVRAGSEINMSGFTISWSKIVVGYQSSLMVIPLNFIIIILFRKARPLHTAKAFDESKMKTAHNRDTTEIVETNIDEDVEANLLTANKVDKNILLSGSKKKKYALNDKKKASSTKKRFGNLFKIKKKNFDDIEAVESGGFSLPVSRGYSNETISAPSSVYLSDIGDSVPNIEALDSRIMPDVISTAAIARRFSEVSISLLDGTNYWPWGTQYIAWFLCFTVTLTSGFFVLLYGISFGRSGQEDWLFSFFISVFSDILFHQPIQVIVFAALFTLVMKKLKDEYIVAEIENFKNIELFDKLKLPEGYELPEGQAVPAPPSPSYIRKMRSKRLYESKMVDVTIEIIAYTLYVFLCLLLTYGHRDPNAYTMTNNMHNIFIQDKFDQIRTVPDFWKWAVTTLTPNLLEEGENITTAFLSDQVTWLVGRARIRQLRSKQESCYANGYFGLNGTDCAYSFTMEHEDKTAQYCESWQKCEPGEIPLHPSYWSYQEDDVTGDYTTKGSIATYSGGGYTILVDNDKETLDSNMVYLYDHTWFDSKTRAVVIEFTAYNTQSNFYVMLEMLLEIPAVGGVFPSYKIITTRLDRYNSVFSVFLGVCETLFLTFTIYYMYRELKRFKVLKLKYFFDWRNLLEVVNFGLIWTTVVLYIIRFFLVSKAKSNYFANKHTFSNFGEAALGDRFYGHTLAFVVVITFTKFIKLLRFNKKMSLMFKTLLYASNDLKYFSISFLLLFMSYTQLGYLLFHTHLEEYATLFRTMTTLFTVLLGDFDFHAMLYVHYYLGSAYFITFVFSVTYIFLNMFISIIIDSFARVQYDLLSIRNKYELVDFLKERISRMLPAAVLKKTQNIGKLLSIKHTKDTPTNNTVVKRRKRPDDEEKTDQEEGTDQADGTDQKEFGRRGILKRLKTKPTFQNKDKNEAAKKEASDDMKPKVNRRVTIVDTKTQEAGKRYKKEVDTSKMKEPKVKLTKRCRELESLEKAIERLNQRVRFLECEDDFELLVILRRLKSQENEKHV